MRIDPPGVNNSAAREHATSKRSARDSVLLITHPDPSLSYFKNASSISRRTSCSLASLPAGLGAAIGGADMTEEGSATRCHAYYGAWRRCTREPATAASRASTLPVTGRVCLP